MSWLPIETAPKDWTGLWLLSYSNIRLSHWVSEGYPGYAGKDGWYYRRHKETGLLVLYQDTAEESPTHWFPHSAEPIPPLPETHK